jgi:HK97 family phage major capsid protein
MDPRRKRLGEILAKARAISAKVEGEARDFDDTERAEVKALFDEAQVIATALKARETDDETIKNLLGLGNGIDLDTVADFTDPTGGGSGKARGMGDLFIAGTKDYVKSLVTSGGGHVSEKARVHTPAVGFAGLKGLRAAHGAKAIVSGSVDTQAGALVQSDWRGLPDPTATFQRELPLIDAITVGTTDSDTVEYARVTGFTNNAAPAAEATGVQPYTEGAGNVEGAKPQSAMTLAKVTAPVRTIAHWIPATKRALSDAGQVRTLIDNFLLYGLEEELEDQIINGDGNDEDFEGILDVSGTQAQAWDTDLLTTTRKAITKVRVNGKARVTAFAMHPNDEERLDLLKNSNGDFYFGGPVTNGVQTLWGRPRVVSEAIPEGTMIAGDWRMAVLWDREQAAIQATDSHADFFVRNLVAILAELRAAFGILRPAAFCLVDVEAGS